MTQQKAASTLILNVECTADSFADLGAGMFLQGPVGLYRKGALLPTLVPNAEYYCRVPTGNWLNSGSSNRVIPEMTQVKHLWHEPITHDVYNQDGSLLIPAAAKKNFSTTPTRNPVAVQVVHALIEHVIENHSNIYPVEHETREDVILSFMHPDISRIWNYYTKRGPADQVKYDPVSQRLRSIPLSDNFEVIDRQLSLMLGGVAILIEEQVRQWLDKYHWNVIVTNVRGTDVVIHRGEDYRIVSWEEEHGARFRQLNRGKKIR